MLGKIPKDKRKRFIIFSVFVLPVLFLLGFAIGSIFAKFIGLTVDGNGKLFVAVGMIPLYLICIHAMYKKLRDIEKHQT